MKAPKIVQAPIGCCSYLTAGKSYEVTNIIECTDTEFGYVFKVLADNGMSITCLENKCSHADGNWIIIERES